MTGPLGLAKSLHQSTSSPPSKENARDSGDEASGFGTGTLVTRDQRRDEEARSAGEAGGRRPPELERSAAERNGADGRPECSEAR